MAYFPFFINLKNKKCCIFGGGMVAYRKIEALLEFEADITIIAPLVCEEISKLEDKLHMINRPFQDKDIEGAFLVIAATDNAAVNNMISDACKKKDILVNVVDELDQCSFLFPAYIKKGDITVGITTSGKSPVMASLIKKVILESIPDYYETLVNTLGRYREWIKKKIDTVGIRAEVFKELADLGIKREGRVTKKDVDAVIRRQGGRGNRHEEND